MDPDDFVKRVEKALDMIAAAKEQGIELKKVFAEWDKLADEGGERLEKLPAAIKLVAEDAVREKFWKSIEEKLVDAGVKVFDGEIPDGILETAYYLGLADINGNDVSIDSMERVVENAARVLKNARPIPMYKISEVADVLVRIGLRKVSSAEELEYVSEVIAGLEHRGKGRSGGLPQQEALQLKKYGSTCRISETSTTFTPNFFPISTRSTVFH